PNNWRIENDQLQATLHAENATLTVLDKRNNYAWEQTPTGDKFKVTQAKIDQVAGGTELTAKLDAEVSGGAMPITIRLLLRKNDAAVELEIAGETDAP